MENEVVADFDHPSHVVRWTSPVRKSVGKQIFYDEYTADEFVFYLLKNIRKATVVTIELESGVKTYHCLQEFRIVEDGISK